jgi:hypothetical protein
MPQLSIWPQKPCAHAIGVQHDPLTHTLLAEHVPQLTVCPQLLSA